ncbi:glycoside hydrolase family 26 protein [Streptomyces sp. DH24]|uniref:glycoside hydrolase family 26 protein n=1 Tax=Streptomyces sp. DH24 TaxID=3040123 RepID=UPI0024411BF4|nr:glycosyl hydrolase [Streptomyces sp. DH24]MDG9716760.1 glycosyl hydrolase [Streptomyces sp. DH24]
MTPRKRRARTRRLACAAVTAAATAVLASGPAAGVAPDADPSPEASPQAPGTPEAPEIPEAPQTAQPPQASPQVTGTPPPPAADTPAFGAYLHYGERGVARIAEFSRWLGGADLRVGHTYLPGDRWSNIEGAPDFLRAWADWRNERDDRMFVLNVPMLERNEAGVSDHEVRRLLRQGAAGQFDHHFRALAERLVALKVPDTIVVLGWEMNGTTYTHRCGPDPEAWKAYWQRIVTTMRAVPGQKFRFDFTPSRGRDAIPWTQCYPGDDTVDIVGMDAYDQPRGMPFDEQVREPYGLQEHVEFAKAHGKAISYPEWGLFRNGDNAEYMRRMLAWMDEHKPLYNTLTDYCPHGVWSCAANPGAAEVYRSVLSGRTGGPAEPPASPAPTPQPTPPGTVPPAGCSPLDLGDWVEYWLGGKLCLRFDWWSRTR